MASTFTKAVALLGFLSGSTLAYAQSETKTTTMAVSATVSSNCLITNSPALTFNAYTPDLGAQDATATVDVKCSNTTPFNIGLNAGIGTGATITDRVMKSGSNTLTYQLFRNPGRTDNWGNTPGTDTLSGVGTGLNNTLSNTIYGRIPSQPDVVPGAYTDTVTLTVSY